MTVSASWLQAARDFDTAMRRFQRTMMSAGISLDGLCRRLNRKPRRAPAAVKPALRGRRHGW